MRFCTSVGPRLRQPGGNGWGQRGGRGGGQRGDARASPRPADATHAWLCGSRSTPKAPRDGPLEPPERQRHDGPPLAASNGHPRGPAPLPRRLRWGAGISQHRPRRRSSGGHAAALTLRAEGDVAHPGQAFISAPPVCLSAPAAERGQAWVPSRCPNLNPRGILGLYLRGGTWWWEGTHPPSSHRVCSFIARYSPGGSSAREGATLGAGSTSTSCATHEAKELPLLPVPLMALRGWRLRFSHDPASAQGDGSSTAGPTSPGGSGP